MRRSIYRRIPISAACLALSISALILVVASGTALAAAPKNTALPTISPTTVEIGKTATASTGTWSSEAPVQWFEGESSRLKLGEKVAVKAIGARFDYAATVGGLTGAINCGTEITNASLENPAAGTAGVGSASLAYKGCETEGSWSKCAVTPAAETVPVSFALSPNEGNAKIAIQSTGANLGKFSLSGASCPEAVEGSMPVFGTINGYYSNLTSSINFNSSTGSMLRFKNQTTGPKITATGAITLTAVKGGSITAKGLSYIYSWSRCESSCVAIPGATASTYTPERADLGKSLKVTVTASDANGTTAATSLASAAVVGTPAWYVSSAPNSWEKVNSKSFTSTNSLAKGTKERFWLNLNYQGLVLEIACDTAEGTGNITSGASQANVEGYKLTVSECVMENLSPCHLASTTLSFASMGANSTTTAASFSPTLTFYPTVAGSYLLEFRVAGCSGLEGDYELGGSLPATVQNEPAVGGRRRSDVQLGSRTK